MAIQWLKQVSIVALTIILLVPLGINIVSAETIFASANPCTQVVIQKSPNDPRFSEQINLNQVKVPPAWDVTVGNSNQVIAIIDTGVNSDHEDLLYRIWINNDETPNNGIDDDNNGYIDDYKGYNMSWTVDASAPDNTINTDTHGTNVTGIAAATTNNGLGIAGVGYKCRFFPIKASKYGSTSIRYGYQSMIYAAIRGCKVLNCSWGSVKPFSDIDQTVVDFAIAHDMVIV
ncbi:MAG: S8 family serine peptidase, partial [Patescibacteria group bacterium]